MADGWWWCVAWRGASWTAVRVLSTVVSETMSWYPWGPVAPASACRDGSPLSIMSQQNNPWCNNYSNGGSTTVTTTTPTSQLVLLGGTQCIPGRKEKFEAQVRVIAADIQSTIAHHVNGLHARRDHLLDQLDTIRKVYLDVLEQQQSDLSYDGLDGDSMLPHITFTKPDLALHKVS